MSFLLNPYVFSDSSVFEAIFDTRLTGAGSSDVNSLVLPIPLLDAENLAIDWGDGTTNNLNTHTYTEQGIKRVKIRGFIKSFCYNNSGDKLKIKEILSWGVFEMNNINIFYGCSNLNLESVIGIPILTGANGNLSQLFRACSNLRFISGFDKWNFSTIYNIGGLFHSCTQFNQDISNIDVSNVTIAGNFMTGKTSANYNASYLDAIYNKWSQLPLKSGVTIGFGSIKYTSAGQAGRDILTTTYGWTITDGGI